MSEPSPIVLVVDDEIQIRRFLRTGFELNGFVVHEAGTGAERTAANPSCKDKSVCIEAKAARAVQNCLLDHRIDNRRPATC